MTRRYTEQGSGSMPVIYIDVLFILNLWVDFCLLSATARLRRLPVKRWRLFLGAAAGAAGSCVLFLPPMGWLMALLVRAVGTVALTLITFSAYDRRTFFKTLLTFVVLSAAFSGLATMLWYLITPAGFLVVNGVVYYDAPAGVLIITTAVSYVAVCLFEYCFRRRAPKNRRYQLRVQNRGKTVVCTCLYDSGSTLREPFSGSPAVVIDRAAAEGLLPPEWPPETGGHTGGHFRFIPFRTLSGEGLLPAFRPEYMAVVGESGKSLDVSGSFLAVCDQLGSGEYTALVGTDIGDLMTERNGR